MEKQRSPRRNYTIDFKKEMAVLVETSRKPIKQVSRETGIAENNLRKWKKLYGKPRIVVEESIMSPKELSEEVRRLRVELKERAEEVEILKKATAYFAQTVKVPSMSL